LAPARFPNLPALRALRGEAAVSAAGGAEHVVADGDNKETFGDGFFSKAQAEPGRQCVPKEEKDPGE